MGDIRLVSGGICETNPKTLRFQKPFLFYLFIYLFFLSFLPANLSFGSQPRFSEVFFIVCGSGAGDLRVRPCD